MAGLPKLPQEQQLTQEIITEDRTTPQELQASLASVDVVFMI